MAKPFIPPKTARLIRELGLTESQVLEAYVRGEKRKGSNKKVHKYPAYTIQITYNINETGETIITWVAKW